MQHKIEYTEREGHPIEMTRFELTDTYLECQDSSDLIMRVYFISDDILRFRYAIDGRFDADFSYALDTDYNPTKATVSLEDQGAYLVLHTATLDCRIDKNGFGTTITDKDGNVLNQDEKGFHWEKNHEYGGYIVQMTKVMQTKEAFYGLGDKPTDLNIAGKRFTNWGTDEYGFHKDTDPIYKSIPIYYGLHNGIGYGMFFDNTFQAYFDFGKERTDVVSFWAQGGEMNYYFIAGPKLIDVCKRYTLLTGTPEMPPLWSLGYQQCKWSYYPESQVKEICTKMREYQIPCDAIYLDIDYMDGWRCFTWDKERFPDPKRMVDELKADGFKTMVIIDPGIKIDKNYSIFTEGLEKGYFCKRVDGHYVEGKVWPGECYFPDFTRPEVREWWADLYEDLINNIGVAGVWNDMNEPALFEVPSKTFPMDVMHDYDGHPTSHRKAHNIYGMQMARATAEGVKKHNNGKRSLIITRSGYSGLQRYSSVWSGDNIASWEHLWIADVQAQRLAISGISFNGSDIGGFIEQPTGELFVRWIQLGIFHPFCRVHSSGDHGDQEPWSFGDEYATLFKKFVELRYQILPYLYTSFYDYHKNGTPMLQPLVFFDQSDASNIDRDHEFLCGSQMLVCPVAKEKELITKVYLPSGEWYDYWNKSLHKGGQEVPVTTSLETVPLFIKAGAIVPMYPIQQYVGEKQFDTVTMDAYYLNGEEESQYYEDAHDNYDYESGGYRLARLHYSGSGNGVTISQNIEGNFDAPYKNYTFNFIGIPFKINKVVCDNVDITIDIDTKTFTVPYNFSHIEIS